MKTTHKILVVDDDPIVGRSFERVLSNKGYAVINCTNGKDALEKLQNEEYDAVFTDLKMSEMDGLEVASRVKANKPWMPVVIITGYATDAALKKASLVGVNQFIQKPLSPEMIESMANEAVNETFTETKAANVEICDQIIEIENEKVETIESQSKIKAIALFLIAPFIGLLYALAMPIVGLGMLANLALKNAKARFVLSIIAAPFIGLVFVLSLPLIGFTILMYNGIDAFCVSLSKNST